MSTSRRLAAAMLCLCFAALVAAQTPPLTPDQDKLIEAMRRYADQYISSLPNFLCVQVTEQFQGDAQGEHWHRGDTLTQKLVFQGGHEERTLELVNHKPVKPGRKHWRAPLTTEGEFGMLLDRVLGPASAATLEWRGWDTVRDRRVAVFNFSIDQQHSTLTLTLEEFARATVPHHGSIYADPATGAVWRITNIADDIPPRIQTKNIATTIDYDEIPIGAGNYILPLAASVFLSTGLSSSRNEIQFKSYRKFDADSTITFGPEQPGATTKARAETDKQPL